MTKHYTWKEYRSMLFVFVSFFIFHAIIAVQMRMLHIRSDEMGVLASAAFLAGENWSGIVKNFPYYGYGQALFYVPVFLITKNPDLRYIAMGIINSLILSMIPVIIYVIAIKYIGMERKDAKLTAFCVGFFPSYTSFTKWIWNEIMLSVLPVLLLFLILLLLENKENTTRKKLFCFFLSFCSVYGFAVHGRGLGIIAAVLLTTIYINCYLKETIIDYLAFFSGYLWGGVLYIWLKKYFTNNLWLLQEGKTLNNTTANIMPSLKILLNPDYITGNLRAIIGQFYTACMSTHGIILLFFIVMLFSYIRKKSIEEYDKKEHVVYIFSLLSFMCAYAISVVAVSPSNLDPNSRGDYPVYIRYFSHVLGLVLFSILVMLKKGRVKLIHFILSLFGIILLSIGAVWKIQPFINSRKNIANIPLMNILPFIGPNPPHCIKHVNFVSLSFVTFIVFSLICLLLYFNRKTYIPILLISVFIFVYYENVVNVILPNNRIDYEKIAVPKQIMAQIEWKSYYPKCYYYNPNQKKPWSDSMLQFALPQFPIENITMEQIIQSEMDHNSIIISTEDLALETFDNSFYKVENELLDTGIDFIWIYGEDLKLFVESNSDLDFYGITN